jgi:hypothetical protein
MFCGRCGKQLKDTARFCPACGTAVAGTVARASVPTATTSSHQQTARPPTTLPQQSTTASGARQSHRWARKISNFNFKALGLGIADVMTALIPIALFIVIAIAPLFLRVNTAEDTFSLLGSHSLVETLGVLLFGFETYHPSMLTIAVALAIVFLLVASGLYWATTAVYITIRRPAHNVRFLATVFSCLGVAALIALGFMLDTICPQLQSIVARMDGIHASLMTSLGAPFTIIIATLVLIDLIGMLFIGSKRRAK